MRGGVLENSSTVPVLVAWCPCPRPVQAARPTQASRCQTWPGCVHQSRCLSSLFMPRRRTRGADWPGCKADKPRGSRLCVGPLSGPVSLETRGVAATASVSGLWSAPAQHGYESRWPWSADQKMDRCCCWGIRLFVTAPRGPHNQCSLLLLSAPRDSGVESADSDGTALGARAESKGTSRATV